MTTFSRNLMDQLSHARVAPGPARPRILFGPEDVPEIRSRARADARVVDAFAARAERACVHEGLFGPKPDIPYFCLSPLRELSDAALVLEDERYAMRALEGVEVMFRSSPEEWVARPHRPMRCDHAMLNVASAIGITLDLCAEFWPADAIRSVSERIEDYTVARFLETWRKQDAHWASPTYHWNWKIMCCGEMGTAALACAEAIGEMEAVMEAAAAGCLDILDAVPAEGDWPEGPGYWLGTLAHGIKFGLGLRRATAGRIDLLDHPALRVTGDYIVHLTEPDNRIYNFNDNGIGLGAALDNLSLLAARHRRGDWARTARAGSEVSLERLAWDDAGLKDEPPPDTARSFPATGVVLMRSGWDAQATFVGMKSSCSDVGHSQLDANSFVVTARGERMLVDEGIWPYGHLLGFFDTAGGRRWNFDANGTVGHNTLLVDHEGQRFGREFPGRIVRFQPGEVLDVATADGAAAYGGRLTKYLRTLAFVKPDLLLVYDQVEADRPRIIEWLFHHRAEVTGDERMTVFRRNGVTLSLGRVMPVEAECWRVSDVARTSSYTNSNTLQRERPSVQYRGIGPFHPCREIEALWGIYVGAPEAMPRVTAREEGARLRVDVSPAGGKALTLDLRRN